MHFFHWHVNNVICRYKFTFLNVEFGQKFYGQKLQFNLPWTWRTFYLAQTIPWKYKVSRQFNFVVVRAFTLQIQGKNAMLWRFPAFKFTLA